MVDVGDHAPEFTGSLAHDGIEPFRLSEHLGEGVVVLAFFPAAFSNTCTDEVCALRDGFDRFESVGGTVYGVSTDLPHALQAYRREYDLPFGLVADPDHEAIEAFDAVESFSHSGVETVARRSVFAIDRDGAVTYRWLAENHGEEPDYDAVAEAVAAASDDSA